MGATPEISRASSTQGQLKNGHRNFLFENFLKKMTRENAIGLDPYTQHTAGASRVRPLAAAVVNGAVVDIRSLAKRWKENPGTSPRKHERSALAWIQNATSCAPFAFRWCCDVLGLDIRGAQALLLSWIRSGPPAEPARN